MMTDISRFTKTINCASVSSDFLICSMSSDSDLILRVFEAGKSTAVVLTLDKVQELIDFLTEAKEELTR